MTISETNKILSRYSMKCISDSLDYNFASALEELKHNFEDCRNELCLMCEGYKLRHKGACDGCRWLDE